LKSFVDPITENNFDINTFNVTSSAYLFNGLSNFESLYVQCMAFLNVSWVKNLLEMAVLKLSEFPFDTVFFSYKMLSFYSKQFSWQKNLPLCKLEEERR